MTTLKSAESVDHMSLLALIKSTPCHSQVSIQKLKPSRCLPVHCFDIIAARGKNCLHPAVIQAAPSIPGNSRAPGPFEICSCHGDM
jgi:hypothetical protein